MLKKESLDRQSSEKIPEGNTFQIQRIYTKDISFETPRSPMIFQQEWKPEMKLDLDTTATELEPDVNEVVLQITVTANLGSSVAFLCQVQQAGIFITNGFDDVTLSHCLGSYCPTILFPYARECISSLVQRATFPVLNIAPVNFEALLMDYINKTAQQPFQKA